MRLYRRSALSLTVLAMIASIGVLSAATRADACAIETENVRKAEPYGPQLPDCRAYEQVSPANKNTTDATGIPGDMESSPNGESVSYTSVVPFPVATGSYEFPSYLSMRGEAGWSTQGLNALTEPAAESGVRGLTASGEEALIFVSPEEEEKFLLAPGAEVGHGNAYVRNNATGTYKLLAARPGRIKYTGATPDGSRILFTSTTPHELVPGIADEAEEPYLYEWDRETGQVNFVGYVSGEAPAGGTVAGSNERVVGEPAETYVENVISENGSRIFFSELNGAGKIYMREPNATPPRTVALTSDDAQWKTATPDGSKVFYTEGEDPEKNLYMYDVATAKRTSITEGAAGVLGVAGISVSGSYAYFVAEGVLAASENRNKERAEEGKDNLYEWHEGAPTVFVATLSKEDKTDWLGYHHEGEGGSEGGGYKGSRVSADGTRLLISSFSKLTSYNNAGFDEIYLYNALSGELGCVSCNPTGIPTEFDREGVPATRAAHLAVNGSASSPGGYVFTTTRNLSAEGTRVFFQTEEALLPKADSQMNVYEWEQEGTGSCEVEEGVESGGCLYLISTGQSTNGSDFLDASENGGNVFFFTRQSLVGQDQDENVDVYDARENGGFATQNPQPSPQLCASEICRGMVPPSEAIFGAPYSTIFSGSGNLAPPTEGVKPPVKTVEKSTRAHKLAAALTACRKGPKRRRTRCEALAHRRYGTKAKSGGGRSR